MSIATQIQALQADKQAIKNAIISKGGTSGANNGFDDFATDIATIPSGGTPTIQNYKEFTGTISSTVTGSGTEYVLVTDNILSTIAGLDTLVVAVTTDYEEITPYTIIGAVSFNKLFYDTSSASVGYQTTYRLGGTGVASNKGILTKIDNTTASLVVGQLLIVNNNLKWVIRSANYALRPCNYKVQIMW